MSELECIVEETTNLDEEVIKYTAMKKDLEYTIERLRNNIDNSEKLINKLTLDMLSDVDDNDIGELTDRYIKLDATMNKNLELLQKTKKDVSVVISNLNRIKSEAVEVKSITNNVTIENAAISTADLIKQLKEK